MQKSVPSYVDPFGTCPSSHANTPRASCRRHQRRLHKTTHGGISTGNVLDVDEFDDGFVGINLFAEPESPEAVREGCNCDLQRGIPPQRKHVVLESRPNVFVPVVEQNKCGELTGDDVVSDVMREMPQPQSSCIGCRIKTHNSAGIGARPLHLPEPVDCAEGNRHAIKVLLLYMNHMEVTMSSLTAGASIFSLLWLIIFVAWEKESVEDSLLLYIAITHSYEGAAFQFLFILLLVASLTPFAWRFANKQWAEEVSDRCPAGINPLPQHLSRREGIIDGARFPISCNPVTSHVDTCSNAATVVAPGLRCDVRHSNAGVKTQSHLQQHKDISHGGDVAPNAAAAASWEVEVSLKSPWMLLLKPIVPLYIICTALTVAQIALTEGWDAAKLQKVTAADASSLRIVLLTVISVRAGLMSLAVLCNLFRPSKEMKVYFLS